MALKVVEKSLNFTLPDMYEPCFIGDENGDVLDCYGEWMVSAKIEINELKGI